MKLDVAAGEKTRGDNHGGADAVFFELQAKAVDADTGRPARREAARGAIATTSSWKKKNGWSGNWPDASMP